MNLVSNLFLEYVVLLCLVEKLSQEQVLLVEVIVEGLIDIISEKVVIVVEMFILVGNCYVLLGSFGYSVDESGM